MITIIFYTIFMKKILVSADCNSEFEFLIKKINALQAKNQFDMLLCVGNVLKVEQTDTMYKLRSGTLKLPLKTYFIQSGELCKTLNHLYPDGKEILPNLFYLGRSGVKQIDGVKIAYLSGIQNSRYNQFYTTEQLQYSSNNFTIDDLRKLKNNTEFIDILLTNEWPEDKNANPPKQINHKSRYISQIANHLCPRYHFAGMESIYFKRNEYLNNKQFATSFISIGSIRKNEENKQKYLHAIQIVPIKELGNKLERQNNLEANPFSAYNQQFVYKKQLQKKPTEKPLIKNNKQEFTESPNIYFERFNEATHESEIQQFIERWGEVKKLEIFFDEQQRRHKGVGIVVFKDIEIAKKCLEQSAKYTLHGSRIRFSVKNQNTKYTDDNCWFCKQSKIFDESLVFYYGKYCYLALDKGPIVNDHFLVIPYKHLGNSFKLDYETKMEIYKLKNRIRQYFFKIGKSMICYERYLNLNNSVNHNILHCVPIPTDLFRDKANKFQKKCNVERLGFYKQQQANLESKIGSNFYFIMQFDDQYYLKIVKQKKFSFDFGRNTICELLEMTEKSNWKSCVNQEASNNQVIKFRQVLKQCNIIE